MDNLNLATLPKIDEEQIVRFGLRAVSSLIGRNGGDGNICLSLLICVQDRLCIPQAGDYIQCKGCSDSAKV